MYVDMPAVEEVDKVTDLPALVRKQLSLGRVSRDETLNGLVSFLKRLRAGLYNNWSEKIDQQQIDDFCTHLSDLIDHLTPKK